MAGTGDGVSEAAEAVYVIDDDASIRVALTRLLGSAGYRVHAYSSAGEYLLRQRTPAGVVACLILDLRLPGPSGLELQEALAGSEHHLPIIFLTGRGDIASSVSAMKAGAVDFLTKPVEPEVLLEAVERALALCREERVVENQGRAWRTRLRLLTAREHEVLEHVLAGKRNKQIAAALNAAERTVKAHRAHIMEKMGVESVAELIRMAERWRTRPGDHTRQSSTTAG
jgi:FixJ family two-component response regulator